MTHHNKSAFTLLNSPQQKVARLVAGIAFLVLSLGSLAAQLPSQDPGHKANAQVAGIKFSVPNSFNLERRADPRIAFMRHKEYDLALFVAVPERVVDDNYLTSLSDSLVSQLSPSDKNFRWKVLLSEPDHKVSKFQTASGNTKGFNGERFFQIDYITVKVNDHEILVGYITRLGQHSNNSKFLFDLEGAGGMSMPGWYAQAHILASITGEKYVEINPGTVIHATPVKN